MTATADQGGAGGAKEASDSASLVGQVLSARYRIVSLLGEGGMGAVYLAEHVHMRKRLALKVLHPEMVEREEVVARFEREAMAAAHIDHPNVAQATDFGRTDDGAFFLVLEYIEGRSLRAVLQQEGALDAARAVNIARQIASALVRAHDIGIVHRDLKPENIMLAPRGAGPRPGGAPVDDFVKVLDFGIAKVHVEALSSSRAAAPGQALTRAGSIFGTPEYMAPEQALGETVDRRADLYALGVMLYEMLSGRLPFEAGDMVSLLARQIAEPAVPLRVRAPERNVSPELEALVMRLLEKQASRRYDSAAELLTAIDALAAAPPSAWSPPSTAQPSSVVNVMGAGGEAAARVGAAPTAVALSVPSGLPGTAPHVADAHAGPASSAAPRDPRARLRRYLPAVVVALLGGASLVGVLLVVSVLRNVITRASADAGVEAGGSFLGEVFSKEGKEPPRAKALTPEAIDAASATGPGALEALATEFPDDPRVLRALVRAYAPGLDGRGSAALGMRSVVRLLAVDAAAVDDPAIVAAVIGAATSPEPPAQDAGLSVLEGPFGAKGVDILYELASRPAPNPGKARYAASLAKPEVRKRASPALLVHMELKSAKKCPAKHALLARAKEHGDARALVQLKQLQRKGGCGFLGSRDCWPCLRKDGALDDAVQAIESRTGP